MTLKVLLISALDSRRRIEVVYPPLNLAYLVSYAKSKIRDENIIYKIINKDYKKNIITFAPNIVGVSSVTQNYPIAVSIAEFCNKNKIPAFIGGIHISTLPSSLDKNFDFGVIGEAEETFFEIIKLFSKKKTLQKKDLSRINGLVFFNKKNKLKFTKPRELIKNLDLIPFPARELLDIDRNYLFMFTSRGCPYRCYFCSSASFWKTTRFHSADYIIKEMLEIIKRYNPKKITFYDDLFIADKNRLEEVVKKIEQLKINKRICFHISARANLINDEIVSLLKRMNVWSINIGFESGSEKVLNYLKGDSVTIEDNTNAINLLSRAGIIIGGSFIIGSPIETKENVLETYNFIKKYKIDNFAVFTLTPYPGTKTWDYALEHGLVSEHMDFSNLCIDNPPDYDKKITISPNLSKKEIYEFHKRFLRLHKLRQFRLALKVIHKKPQNVIRNILKRIKFRDLGYN